MSKALDIVVVGAGSSGLEEMREFMWNCEVVWALVRLEFGSGSFARSKCVFLHFTGKDAPPLKRGKANSMTEKLRKAVEEGSPVHASIHFEQVSDVTLENVIGEAGKNMVIDSMPSGAVASMKEHQKQMARGARWAARGGKPVAEEAEAAETDQGLEAAPEAAASAEVAAAEEQPSRVSKLQTSAQLQQVGRTNGGVNWALVGADATLLPLIGCGEEGVDELRQVAQENEDQVMYGLLRMPSGEGRLMRDKWVVVHIIGQTVKPVKRGQGNALRPQMEQKFREFANFCISIPDMSAKEVTKEALLEEIRRNAINDDDVAQDDGEHISLAAFGRFKSRDSLDSSSSGLADDKKAKAQEVKAPEKEEAQAQEEDEAENDEGRKPEGADGFSGNTGQGSPEPPYCPQTVKEAVDLVHKDCICNWALFAPKQKRR